MPPALIEDTAHRALRRAAAALDAAELRGHPFQTSQALTALARCYAALDHVAAARACLQSALRWAAAAGSIDHGVELLCELCEMAARRADELGADDGANPALARTERENARDHAIEAAALACRVADPGWEVRVLLRVSDVLDRCGDRDQALQLQTRALRLLAGQPARADSSLLPGLGRLADV